MILAIDPSVANTALVYGDATWCDARYFHSKPKGTQVRERIARYEDTVQEILAYLDSWDEPLEHCLIEGYKLGGEKKPYEDNLAEFGCVLRWHLADVVIGDIIEIAPTSIKKFTTDNGQAGKELMKSHIAMKWPETTCFLNNEHERDAYALFRMGLVIYGHCQVEHPYEAEAAIKAIGYGEIPVTGPLTRPV